MKTFRSIIRGLFSTATIAAPLTALFAFVGAALALPPAPANDTPGTAEVLSGPTPIVVYGTTVLADDTISTTTLAAPVDDVDGPDVYYRFTPSVTDTYRVHLLPWQRAPLRSSDRRFTIYVFDAGGDIAGARASSTARPVHFDVALTSGTPYTIAVDYNSASREEFPFTLIVDTFAAGGPGACGSAEVIPTTLPHAVLRSLDGGTNDFTFIEGVGLCDVANTPAGNGDDHVYKFTPATSGEYTFELATNEFNPLLYVLDACPGTLPMDCIGASNSSTSGGGKHELLSLTLQAGTDYWIVVDDAVDGPSTGAYALIVDTSAAYEMNEVEPNDTFSTATPVSTPLNGGQLIGGQDEDWWSVTGSVGDRVYAWVNNGGSSNSTLDTDLAFYATNGTTLIEFDDEDGDGIDSPIEDLRFIYSTTSPVIAGARMNVNGTFYWQVTDRSATGTVHRYRFHTGVIPGTWDPQAEVEPNDNIGNADRSGRNFFSGVVPTSDDLDVYAFEATAGDRVFVALDGDPERDGTANDSANNDPKAFHAKLVIYDPAGDVLISDISDSNSIQSAPDYPAQGGFFVARSTGTHYVQVGPQSTASQVGPDETYEVAVFLNDAPASPAETVDPVCTATPDYDADTIAVTVTDNAGGDVGICSIDLIDNFNLQVSGLSFTPGDPSVSFDVALSSSSINGFAKLVATDCAGNTSIQNLNIDVLAPQCGTNTFSSRSRASTGGTKHVPNNDPAGAEVEIEIEDAGLVDKVTVTMTIDTFDPADLDIFLISPQGSSVELVTDRMSSLGIDMVDVTFDDDADELIPILSSAAPYTGSWLPEQPLDTLIGVEAQGAWTLRVIDDSSSDDFGATIVRWSIDIDITFAAPEQATGFAGEASSFESGLSTVVLSSASNLLLTVPGSFTPGDPNVVFGLSLIDPSLDGTGAVTVTDTQENACVIPVSLDGLPDTTGPVNAGSVTKNYTFSEEVQQTVPSNFPTGVTSTISVPDGFDVGEVEIDLAVYAEDQGRIAAKLEHGGQTSVLVNRISMDDRGALGNSKSNMDVTLDDDAPVADDIHEEPALGSISLIGLHQPDGRGAFFGDGITTDDRDNMLFALTNQGAAGDWSLNVGDFRAQGTVDNIFRRWRMVLKNPCGPDRYVGVARDLAPGTGICALSIMGGVNATVDATFSAGDAAVEYAVELVDPGLAGGGTILITDCASNTTMVPFALAAESADSNPPVVSGAINTGTGVFEGTATDNQAGDGGIETVDLLPYSTNLQIDSVVPAPPGAAALAFEVSRINALENGRGYLRVTDACGHRSYLLIEFDALAPTLATADGRTKRYLGPGLPQVLPDNNSTGVTSVIAVADADVITDANITLNITHGFDDDIDAALTSPAFIPLFSDIGSTGNDFRDTTIDDEAAGPMPDSSTGAPFTGSFQPEGGPALFALDGSSAVGNYALNVADDKTNDFGSFDSWALTLESFTFAKRHDGRVGDTRTFDTGIASIVLLGGASNLTLNVDPFTPCDGIVRYSVELLNRLSPGTGTVRITDCAGNTIDDEICLIPTDLDDDCDTDFDDLLIVLSQWTTCGGGCLGDIDGDGIAGFDDLILVLSQWTIPDALLAGRTGVIHRSLLEKIREYAAWTNVETTEAAEGARIVYINSTILDPLDHGGVFRTQQDYLQTADGILAIEIDGPLPVDEYDVLVVPGRAQLGGVLSVAFGENHEPRAGDRFVLVASAQALGSFSELDLPALPDGLEFAVETSSRGVALWIVEAAERSLLARAGESKRSAEAGGVTMHDLLAMLGRWNAADETIDLDGDGVITGADLRILLDGWR